MTEYSPRFPNWVYEHDPGTCYIIEKSRKLFGKQRYGFAKSLPRHGCVNHKDDYKSFEEALPWLNSLNLYADIWEVYLNGDMTRVKKMDLIISGDNPEDQNGYSDGSIFANVAHSDPGKVARALKLTDNMTRETVEVKTVAPSCTLNQFF